MSFFDGDLVPQNTPESAADPFVTALTAAMEHQPQDQVSRAGGAVRQWVC